MSEGGNCLVRFRSGCAGGGTGVRVLLCDVIVLVLPTSSGDTECMLAIGDCGNCGDERVEVKSSLDGAQEPQSL